MSWPHAVGGATTAHEKPWAVTTQDPQGTARNSARVYGAGWGGQDGVRGPSTDTCAQAEEWGCLQVVGGPARGRQEATVSWPRVWSTTPHPDPCCHFPISLGCFRCGFLPDTARCWGQACLSSQQCQEPTPPAWVICGPGRPTARLVGTERPLVPGDRLAVHTHACSAVCQQMGDRVPGCRCWQPSALWLSHTPFSLR